MTALRRLWEGWPGIALILAVLALAVAAHVASETCGRDPGPLGVRGTLDGDGRFVPAGGGR